MNLMTVLCGRNILKSICLLTSVAMVASLLSGCEAPGAAAQGSTMQPQVRAPRAQTWSPGQQQKPATLAGKPLVENRAMYQDLMAEGNAQRDRGQTSKALELYRQAASLNPGDVDAQRHLADTAFALGYYSEAAAAYVQVLAARTDDVDMLRGATESLLASGQPAAALSHAERWVKLQPENQDARLGLARAQNLMGQYEQAEQSYQKAAELGPRNTALLLGLGEVYLRAGNADKAIEQFQNAIDLQPSALAHERLALAQLRGDHFDLAVQQYHKALAIDPSHINALNGLGVCLSRQYFHNARPDFSIRNQAIEALQRSLRINANQPAIVELLSHLMKH
ncbi:MAG: tetratricopeptide repeat protein [Phycisphaeraceae bacterium]|nr:tetratricopeptide repeat protein [Phycisphaeraceae bacterium]